MAEPIPFRSSRGQTSLPDAIRRAAVALDGSLGEYDPVLDLVGDARIVLLGEASHGTHEFYAARAAITKRLILEKSFTAIAVEADWPDAYRVNRYVRGRDGDLDANQALGGFKRFPTWMWRNTDVLDLVEWLREHNQISPGTERQVSFFGLDLYSLYGSIAAVLEYLDNVDPEAARRARERYACFEHFGEDTERYGYSASYGVSEPCQQEVVAQLVELQQQAARYARRDGELAEEEYFFAEQNARVVKNAEEYYRTMFFGNVESWNLRDRHMADTLEALVQHFEDRGRTPKVVVWAHNSHLGDARATEMGRRGEWNVGQLARERFDARVRNVGFTTFSGTVTAAHDWDAPGLRRWVRPALAGSFEHLFHQAEVPRFFLNLRQPADKRLAEELREPRLERAIGVVYRPETERMSHYFSARLTDQFDGVIHLDQTTALEPLERAPEWETEEPPETYPFAV